MRLNTNKLYLKDLRTSLRTSGFTLIELVLVIAIAGILVVGVTTLTIDYKKSYLDTTSKKVRSDIEYARGYAMTKKGTTFGVFFDKNNNRYTVYQGTVTTPVLDPQTKQDLIETFAKWPGVSITGNNYTVEFNSVGAPTTGGGGSVSLTDGSTTKIISVLVDTGKVTVQ